MDRKSHFLPVFVGAVVVGLIAVSLFASRSQRDRETEIAAARYDGKLLLAQLGAYPAEPVDYLEVEAGPLHNDLRTRDEAWVSWRQSLIAPESFDAATEWHRSLLIPLGWGELETGPTAGAVFAKDLWRISLLRLPQPNSPPPPRFRREVEWNRQFGNEVPEP